MSAKSFSGFVVNGNLACSAGRSEDYWRFVEGIAPLTDKSQVALSLGDHDDRTSAIVALTDFAGEKESIANKWVSVIDAGPLRVVLLDSLKLTDATPGLLGEVQFAWLARYIPGHTEHPVLVFVHHTLDNNKNSLLDAAEMLAIFKPQRHVKAVSCGHRTHINATSRTDCIWSTSRPAITFQRANRLDGWKQYWTRRASLTPHAFAGNRAQDGRTRKLVWR